MGSGISGAGGGRSGAEEVCQKRVLAFTKLLLRSEHHPKMAMPSLFSSAGDGRGGVSKTGYFRHRWFLWRSEQVCHHPRKMDDGKSGAGGGAKSGVERCFRLTHHQKKEVGEDLQIPQVFLPHLLQELDQI